MSVRAAVLTARRRVSVEPVAVGELPASGGWLDVECCGVCGSDWNAFTSQPANPLVLGHEIVGTVAELWGDERADVAVGDRVVLEEALSCHRCAVCLSGRHRLCPNSGRYGGTALSSAPGLWGGFAERVFVAPNARVHHVPAGLDGRVATLFIPLSNGLSWLTSTARLAPGESVLVMGAGQHGLASVAAARRSGAGLVIAAGKSGDAARLAAAQALGADVVLDVDETPLVAQALDLTGGRGFDIVVDTTPGPAATLDDAVRAAAIGGRVVIAGIKRGSTSSLDTDVVLRREIQLLGVAARESRAIDAALAWLAQDPSIAAHFGGLSFELGDIEAALLTLGGEGDGPRPSHAVVNVRS
jgi:threonine dehydrogenase-like Zn-dependent dehydrogenase